MDTRAPRGRDRLWKTFSRRGSTVSMDKSLVYLEFLMVCICFLSQESLAYESLMVHLCHDLKIGW